MALLPLNIDLTAINKNTGRILEFRELKRQIRPLMEVLNIVPESEVEKAVMEQWDNFTDDPYALNTEMITKSKTLLVQLKNRVAAQAEKADDLITQIQCNWNRLKECSDPSLQYTVARSDVIHMLETIFSEQQKIERKRLECIRSSIAEIRNELVETWKQCMVAAEERNFTGFQSSDFTYELLELHKAEITKWKAFHDKNYILFTSIEKRQNLWQRLKELQAKSEDPNRFVNRGGVLLKSQKEMNYVSAALPKCEDKLLKLARNFETENGRKLLILGKPIREIITQDWAEHKESIRNRNSSKPVLSRASVLPCSASRSASRPPLNLAPATGEKRPRTCQPCPNMLVKRGRIEDDLREAENQDQENLSEHD